MSIIKRILGVLWLLWICLVCVGVTLFPIGRGFWPTVFGLISTVVMLVLAIGFPRIMQAPLGWIDHGEEV